MLASAEQGSEKACDWKWEASEEESRGFAPPWIRDAKVPDGQGGKMTGIVAVTDIVRGRLILEVPMECTIWVGQPDNGSISMALAEDGSLHTIIADYLSVNKHTPFSQSIQLP